MNAQQPNPPRTGAQPQGFDLNSLLGSLGGMNMGGAPQGAPGQPQGLNLQGLLGSVGQMMGQFSNPQAQGQQQAGTANGQAPQPQGPVFIAQSVQMLRPNVAPARPTATGQPQPQPQAQQQQQQNAPNVQRTGSTTVLPNNATANGIVRMDNQGVHINFRNIQNGSMTDTNQTVNSFPLPSLKINIDSDSSCYPAPPSKE